MGLLDDAIREHLELKRRGGADAGEVERLEQEALGPARREPQEPDFDPEPAAADEPDDYLPTAADEEVQSLAEDEEPFYDDDLLGEAHQDEDVDERGPEPPATEAQSITDQPTVQFDVAALDEDEDEDEDVAPPGRGADAPHDELEDTPEFLQETPEHDRLWFDQKPPRDFDF
jgi:hypothetical protein